MSGGGVGTEWLEVASDLARRAASRVLALQGGPLFGRRKADHSLVTAADLESDQILCEGLCRAFPEHGLISEEAGYLGPAGAEYVWLVDPLDGTKAYAQGIPGFAVMVGLLHQGEPYLGVVVDPLAGYCYEGLKGEGAFCTKKGGVRQRVFVSRRQAWSEMPLVVSTDFPSEKLQLLQQTLTGPLVAPINSVGIKVGLVVRQVGDIYISHHSVHYWDTAAPQLILEEAGGIMTRLDDLPLSYTLCPPYSHDALTLASNGTRHREIAAVVSPLFQ